MNPSEVKILIHQQVMSGFFQTFKKKWPGVSLRVANPLSLIFASLFSQVKYKTSEIKRTYLYIKIFGERMLFFKIYQMSTFNLKWRNFQSNTVKKLARGFHTGGEPFVTEVFTLLLSELKI